MTEERRQLSVEQAASLLSQQDAAAEAAQNPEPPAPPQNPQEPARDQPQLSAVPDSPPEPAPSEPTEPTEPVGPQQPPQTEEGQPEEVEVQTLDDLAEYLEVQPEYILGMTLKATAGDTEANVSIADLAKSYQLEGSLQKKLSDFGRERKEWEQQQTQRQNELIEKLSTADATMRAFEDQLTGANIDWKELRETAPEEYAARKADVADAKEQLRKARESLAQQMQDERQKQYDQWMKDFFDARQRMWTTVKSSFPEWSINDQAAQKGEEVLTKYLLSDLNFTENDLQMVVDPRLIVMAEKARRYDGLQDGKEIAKKKLKKAKKVIRPGHTPSKGEGQDDKVSALRKQFKRSGNIKDMAKVLSAMDRKRGA